MCQKKVKFCCPVKYVNIHIFSQLTWLSQTNCGWWSKTIYTFEFSFKSSIRIRYVSSCAKKKKLNFVDQCYPSKIFFTDLVSFTLITCPSHSNLRIFITVTISWDLYLFINSVLGLILHCPFSFVGPHIFLNIFLSHVINIFSILLVRAHASAVNIIKRQWI